MALRITELYRPDLSTLLALRLFLCRVPAGFPSPADDYIDEFLDLNKKLITNKSATFLPPRCTEREKSLENRSLMPSVSFSYRVFLHQSG